MSRHKGKDKVQEQPTQKKVGRMTGQKVRQVARHRVMIVGVGVRTHFEERPPEWWALMGMKVT